MSGRVHANEQQSDANQSFLGVPVRLFKTPAAMLLLGIVIATGGNFGLNKAFGASTPVEISAKFTDLQKDIQNLKEDRAETKAQVQALKEQSNRIEAKLDRLLERSLYSSSRR